MRYRSVFSANTRPQAGRTPYAFTLVELLVVLGILSLLAALLLSVIGRVRGRAYQTTCASNLGQLGKAILLYAQDYDGGIPPLTNTFHGPSFDMDGSPVKPNPRDRPDYLWEVVGPFVKTRAVLFCPRDPYADQNDQHWRIDHHYTSYAMQTVSPDWLQDNFDLPRLKRDGSEVAFVADAEYFYPTGSTRPDRPAPRESDHLGVYQMVCYDGSLKRVPAE